MIKRAELQQQIEKAIARSPVTAILGPRQCGKTTIARLVAKRYASYYFDCENPFDSARLESPLFTLEPLEGLVILDEIQRIPSLFEILRVLADRPQSTTRFLILGSASPHLMKNASESLAGRIAFIDMKGFSLDEVGVDHMRQLWFRGSFPPAFLAKTDSDSTAWRQDFIRTFVERDIPQLGFSIPSASLTRFWNMVAHFHGQVLNTAELARSLGASEATARRYIDLLSGAFVIRQLMPWFENLGKRQVKSPKIYICDSGLFHAMQNITNVDSLLAHGKAGASWEGFVIEQLIGIFGHRNLFFWATHAGAELDAFTVTEKGRMGFECKLTDTPRTTRSMHAALSDLALNHLFVIFPGKTSFRMSESITALAISDLWSWERFLG